MPDDRGPELAAVVYLFLVLTWTSSLLRCYVRAKLTKSFGVDDCLAIGALTLFTVNSVTVLLGVHYGTGRHIADLPPGNIPIAFKWWWLAELTYASNTAVFKASIGVFILRICTRKTHKYAIWTVMVVVLLYSTFYFFILTFQCRPVSYFWTQFEGASGSCVPAKVIADTSYTHAAVSATADWTLGILPIFVVWNLKMNARTKISVALLLSLGAVGSTATIVRVPYLHQLLATTDFLYVTTDVAIWSTVEPGIGITCAALACCRPLIHTFLSRKLLWGNSSRGPGKSSWLSSGPSPAGYVRNGSHHVDARDLGIRSDIQSSHKKPATLSKTMHGERYPRDDDDLELGNTNSPFTQLERSTSTQSLRNGTGWTMGDSKLADDSSEDFRSSPPRQNRLRIGVQTTTEISSAPRPGTSGGAANNGETSKGWWIFK